MNFNLGWNFTWIVPFKNFFADLKTTKSLKKVSFSTKHPVPETKVLRGWCKAGFYELIFYNLITQAKGLLFLNNHVICLKNRKLWRAPTTTEFNILADIFHTFSTWQCLQKRFRDSFILYRSWVINKILVSMSV